MGKSGSEPDLVPSPSISSREEERELWCPCCAADGNCSHGAFSCWKSLGLKSDFMTYRCFKVGWAGKVPAVSGVRQSSPRPCSCFPRLAGRSASGLSAAMGKLQQSAQVAACCLRDGGRGEGKQEWKQEGDGKNERPERRRRRRNRGELNRGANGCLQPFNQWVTESRLVLPIAWLQQWCRRLQL